MSLYRLLRATIARRIWWDMSDVHIHLHLPPELMDVLVSDRNSLHKILEILTRMETKMSQMDDNITALQGSVANLTTVDQSAIALIQGFSAQIQAAVDAALAAGATPTQLQAMVDLKTAVDTQDDALAAAVSAATPTAQPTP
jgi:hypothetical protein